MCVSVVDSFVAWGHSCHKQQQNCYEVCRFVSQIALSLPPFLWGRISVGLCTYLTIIIANHFTLLRLMPLGIGRQGPWDIKALSLSLCCPLSRVCVVCGLQIFYLILIWISQVWNLFQLFATSSTSCQLHEAQIASTFLIAQWKFVKVFFPHIHTHSLYCWQSYETKLKALV